ncbi:MAG: class I SAM-dependent methyltransferase [Myxococcales bacterium]|nr:class I SAM-dependent methyltransferase [Myxococcales bacterium]
MLYDVELYRLTHRGHAGDVGFYRRMSEGADPILEMGCGWGRVMLPLLKAGHHVTGLDLHSGMLEALRADLEVVSAEVRERAVVLEADMTDFSLEQRFARVLIPYNSLYALLTEEDQMRCLSRAFEHLLPEGELLLDVYQIDDLDEEEDSEETDASDEGSSEGSETPEETEGVFSLEGGQVLTFEPVVSMVEEDQQIDIFEGRRWDPEAQRLDAVYVYQIEKGGQSEEKRYTIPQRYLRAEQLFRMLREVGFEVGACYADFRGTPWEEGDETLVVQAIRPR